MKVEPETTMSVCWQKDTSYSEDAFSRLDESDDLLFYQKDRFVSHLDETALDTVRRLIGSLVVEDRPVILDLMAGWDSHLPETLRPGKVVGLGLNSHELSENKALDQEVIHDLNRDHRLPFGDNSFDVVVNTVSVDYLVEPVEVFREVGRILKPGGLFLVIFSNRMFPPKAVKIWREASEEERLLLVQDFFAKSGTFDPSQVFVSTNKPRPKNDKYYQPGLCSDPVYAVYAEKSGATCTGRRERVIDLNSGDQIDPQELERRQELIKHNLSCPYCGEKLVKWQVPESPFGQTWDNDHMYICFNDECGYYLRGWDVMAKNGRRGCSYRLMYHPIKDRCLPIPVQNSRSLRESIIEEH
jgi:SAM-dependent methyltransferase